MEFVFAFAVDGYACSDGGQDQNDPDDAADDAARGGTLLRETSFWEIKNGMKFKSVWRNSNYILCRPDAGVFLQRINSTSCSSLAFLKDISTAFILLHNVYLQVRYEVKLVLCMEKI